MKAFLLFEDRDLDLKRALPAQADTVAKDLGAKTVMDAMAAGDAFIADVCRLILLSPLSNLPAILYRQDLAKDCLQRPAVIRELYNTAVEALEAERRTFYGGSRTPGSLLYRSVEIFRVLESLLRRLRKAADAHAASFHSRGFTRLFSVLATELDDRFFSDLQGHLKALRFPAGVLLSAGLGDGNKGAGYVLRKPPGTRKGLRALFAPKIRSYSFTLSDRDEAGARALSELGDKGVNLVANALAQSADHVLSFFALLKAELAFYVGCLNLHERLAGAGTPISFPIPEESNEPKRTTRGLCDAGLALMRPGTVVGNDLDADGKRLVVVTGANQGGKSTFLRSVGLAHLMMQCGMFVSAASFHAAPCDMLFTHFTREEDPSMKSGKFDEELGRMSEIADVLTPRSLLLLNESFSATNEREGSEIAGQIIRALVESGVTIFFVTHMYEFAHDAHERQLKTALFLCAERSADGRRTFRVVPGSPLSTSFGKDVLRDVFGTNGKATPSMPDASQTVGSSARVP